MASGSRYQLRKARPATSATAEKTSRTSQRSRTRGPQRPPEPAGDPSQRAEQEQLLGGDGWRPGPPRRGRVRWGRHAQRLARRSWSAGRVGEPAARRPGRVHPGPADSTPRRDCTSGLRRRARVRPGARTPRRQRESEPCSYRASGDGACARRPEDHSATATDSAARLRADRLRSDPPSRVAISRASPASAASSGPPAPGPYRRASSRSRTVATSCRQRRIGARRTHGRREPRARTTLRVRHQRAHDRLELFLGGPQVSQRRLDAPAARQGHPPSQPDQQRRQRSAPAATPSRPSARPSRQSSPGRTGCMSGGGSAVVVPPPGLTGIAVAGSSAERYRLAARSK